MKVTDFLIQRTKRQVLRAALLLPVIVFTGCGEEKAKPAAATAAPVVQVAAGFEPGPKPNRSKASEVTRANEAMKIADVEFMLRAGVGEAEILNAIAVRGFIGQVVVADANALSTYGASPRLMALVQDHQYVLTPEELSQYNARAQRTAQKGPPVRSKDPKQQQKDFEERQRQIHAQNAPVASGAMMAGALR
jgi:hypothetical protein